MNGLTQYLARHVGRGLRLRSSRGEYLRTIRNPVLGSNQFIVFSFMLHTLDTEQVLLSHFADGGNGSWDGGWLLGVNANNQLYVLNKAIYVGSLPFSTAPEGQPDLTWALHPSGEYEQNSCKANRFVCAEPLQAERLYTVGLWVQGEAWPESTETFRIFDGVRPYKRKGQQLWLDGQYQGRAGLSMVNITNNDYPLLVGRHGRMSSFARTYGDLTVFQLTAFETQDGGTTVPPALRSPVVHNEGRGLHVGALLAARGIQPIYDFDFGRPDGNRLHDRTGRVTAYLAPRTSIGMINDGFRDYLYQRLADEVVDRTAAEPRHTSPLLRDHVFEGGTPLLNGLGLGGELDGVEQRQRLPTSYRYLVDVSGNNMSGDTVLRDVPVPYLYLDNQGGEGTNTLTFAGSSALSELRASSAKLTSLVFEPGCGLDYLTAPDNRLTSLDVRPCWPRVPRRLLLDRNRELTTLRLPATDPVERAEYISATDTGLTELQVDMPAGYDSYFLNNTPALTRLSLPATNQRLTLQLNNTGLPGHLDLSHLQNGLQYFQLIGPNITALTFPPERSVTLTTSMVAVYNTQVTELDLTPLTRKGGYVGIGSNAKLEKVLFGGQAAPLSGLEFQNNLAYRDVVDLTSLTYGFQSFYPGGSPNVAEWRFPRTIDNAAAAVLTNANGSLRTATPRVLDLSATKIGGQMLLAGSNFTEFRYSTPSVTQGAPFTRFDLNDNPELQGFDCRPYPSGDEWAMGLSLQFCRALTTLTFPTGRDVSFHALNLRGTAISQPLPIGDGLILVPGGSLLLYEVPGMSTAALDATVANAWNARTRYANAGEPRLIYLDYATYSRISGAYQAPSGFVLGGPDGTPASPREAMYVLNTQQTADGRRRYAWRFAADNTEM